MTPPFSEAQKVVTPLCFHPPSPLLISDKSLSQGLFRTTVCKKRLNLNYFMQVSSWRAYFGGSEEGGKRGVPITHHAEFF